MGCEKYLWREQAAVYALHKQRRDHNEQRELDKVLDALREVLTEAELDGLRREGAAWNEGRAAAEAALL